MSVGMTISAVGRLGLMEWVSSAKIRELLKEVERYTPLSRFRNTGYAEECVSAGCVADHGFMIGECDDMAGRNNVVHTYEGCAVSVWYRRERVGSDVGCLFNWFCFHVSVADGYFLYGEAVRMFDSHSGVVMSGRHGALVIMTPLSRTALGSSGDVWTSWTIVWARASQLLSEE